MGSDSLSSSSVPGSQKEKPCKIKDRLADKEGFRHNVYWVTGDIYRGCWSHNKKDGVGIHTYKDGSRYEGEWKNGKREGQGTFYVVADGKYRAIYKGSWKSGRWHGKGLLYGECGEQYDGDFENGKRSGFGRQTYWCPEFRSYHVYTGEWVDGKREGIGKLKMANGDVFEGSFVNDVKEGKGSFYYAHDGSKYEGLWKADVPICGTYSKDESVHTEMPILQVQNSDTFAQDAINEAIVKNKLSCYHTMATP